jgi:hypothetical protein
MEPINNVPEWGNIITPAFLYFALVRLAIISTVLLFLLLVGMAVEQVRRWANQWRKRSQKESV